jgi:hypothetical protein
MFDTLYYGISSLISQSRVYAQNPELRAETMVNCSIRFSNRGIRPYIMVSAISGHSTCICYKSRSMLHQPLYTIICHDLAWDPDVVGRTHAPNTWGRFILIWPRFLFMFEMTYSRLPIDWFVSKGITWFTHDYTHGGSRASKPRASMFTLRPIFWPNMVVVQAVVSVTYHALFPG